MGDVRVWQSGKSPTEPKIRASSHSHTPSWQYEPESCDVQSASAVHNKR
jgi:hypothetical protein